MGVFFGPKRKVLASAGRQPKGNGKTTFGLLVEEHLGPLGFKKPARKGKGYWLPELWLPGTVKFGFGPRWFGFPIFGIPRLKLV